MYSPLLLNREGGQSETYGASRRLERRSALSLLQRPANKAIANHMSLQVQRYRVVATDKRNCILTLMPTDDTLTSVGDAKPRVESVVTPNEHIHMQLRTLRADGEGNAK